MKSLQLDSGNGGTTTSSCGCAVQLAGGDGCGCGCGGSGTPASAKSGPVSTSEVLSQLGSGSPMPSSATAQFSAAVGGLPSVQLHADSDVPASMGARALTVGRHVAFAPGQFRPGTPDGDELVNHELAHVVQQAGGHGAVQASGLSYDGYEAEADRAAAAVATGGEIRLTPVRGSIGPQLQNGHGDGDTDTDIFLQVGAIVYLARQQTGPGGELVDAGTGVRVMSVRPPFAVVELPVPSVHAGVAFHAPIRDLTARSPHGPAPEVEHGVAFQTSELAPGEFEAETGLPIDVLPEGQIIPGSLLGDLARGAGQAPWGSMPYPAFPIPANATGVQLTGGGHGHFSQLSNPPGRPQIGGFRSDVYRHGAQSVAGKILPGRSAPAVPGRYYNDNIFRIMPAKQTIAYRVAPAAEATALATRIEGSVGGMKGDYRLPLRGATTGAPCPNCITVPTQITHQALGGQPVIRGPGGTWVNITEQGHAGPRENLGRLTPAQAGRVATVEQWMKDPMVRQPDGNMVRLQTARPGGGTMLKTAGVGVLRHGGRVLLVYGAYKTTQRIAEAPPDQVDRVIAQETGSWTGGLLGAALGTALGGAVACSPTGPGAGVCFAAGFIGGLVFGMVGSVGGSLIGDAVYSAAEEVVENPATAWFPHPYLLPVALMIDEEDMDTTTANQARTARRAAQGDTRSAMWFISQFVRMGR